MQNLTLVTVLQAQQDLEDNSFYLLIGQVLVGEEDAFDVLLQIFKHEV